MGNGRHVAAFFLNNCGTRVSSTMLFLLIAACDTRTILLIYYARSSGTLRILLIIAWCNDTMRILLIIYARSSGTMSILRSLVGIIGTMIILRNFARSNGTIIILLIFARSIGTMIAIVRLILTTAPVRRRGVVVLVLVVLLLLRVLPAVRLLPTPLHSPCSHMCKLFCRINFVKQRHSLYYTRTDHDVSCAWLGARVK